MMTCFYHMETFWQIALLVFSQLTLISFVISIVILYKRGCKTLKLSGVVVAFLLNAGLYILMQLSSRITGATQENHLQISYAMLVIVVALSLVYNLWALISETNWRKTISRNSIKEAFDNLPTGVCFFNDAGIAILCNKAMQRFSFSVCGRDVQIITDIEECFSDDFLPMGGVIKEGTTFVLPVGTVWKLAKRSFTHESGNTYTEYTATNITKLYNNREELRKETEHLRKVQEELKTLSANVVTITREEEILNTKMRVHDEMGRCLLAIQKYLKEDSAEKIPKSIIESWQKAVSMLKYNNDTSDDDMLLQIRKTCESIKLDFVQVGELPKEENTAYILICAIRECVTNAVRYAEATKLYAEFTEDEETARVTITNNGIPPAEEISEGGGLSSLRSRVERFGGEMLVQSLPEFRLTVIAPKRKEGAL